MYGTASAKSTGAHREGCLHPSPVIQLSVGNGTQDRSEHVVIVL